VRLGEKVHHTADPVTEAAVRPVAAAWACGKGEEWLGGRCGAGKSSGRIGAAERVGEPGGDRT